MFATLQIDLTHLGRLIRENKDLTRKVQFKDGEHQLLNIVIGDRREPDKYGNNLNINCRPKDAPKDNKWFIGQGKLWEDKNAQPTAPAPASPTPPVEDDSIPF